MNEIQQLRERLVQVRDQFRRRQCGLVLGGGLLAALGVVTLLALVDYFGELPQGLRVTLLLTSLGVLLMTCLVRGVQQVRSLTMGSIASRLERAFPALGQRLRTMMDHAGSAASGSGGSPGHAATQVPSQGVAPSLVQALACEAAEQTQAINFQQILPHRKLKTVWGAVGLVSLALLISALIHWEWRMALTRALGAKTPYTTLTVQPGNTSLEQGKSLPVEFQVQGRQREKLQVQWRLPDDQAGWTSDVPELHEESHSRRTWTYHARLGQLQAPVEYRVIAGPVISPVYQVGIHYPLKMMQVSTLVQFPDYTRLPDQTIPDGNLSGLAGSLATFSVELDRAPASVAVHISRLGELEPNVERQQILDPRIQGTHLTWKLPLEHDFSWTLSAQSPEGTALPERRFRVRLRPDRPPEVSFLQPELNTEVHTLAEVLLRMRVSDDFGLTRSGIVFQINNLEEHTLLEEDFAQVAATVKEVEKQGQLTARTRAELERVLPLEYFALTQKDAITYYAFAEDNFPGMPHRTQSDLRFIDIRPFRIEYEERTGQARGGEGNGLRGRLPTALDELIRRERRILNRTMKLDVRQQNWKQAEIDIIDGLVREQGLLAALTRELADAIVENAAVEEVDTLYRAQASMLAAVDSLSIGRLDSATVQEKDAQQYLVEARNQLRNLLQRNRNVRQRYARANDRLLSQLYRNQRADEFARTLVARLRGLAREETLLTQIANELSAGSMEAVTGEAADKRQARVVDLENRQYDVATESHQILKRLEQIDDLTGLVKTRMSAAATSSEDAATALGSGDFAVAARETGSAAMQFDELARQVATLTAPDFSQRLAATGLLLGELAFSDRDILRRLPREASSGSKAMDTQAVEAHEGETQKRDTELQDQIQKLQARADTIADLVNDLATFSDPDAGTGPQEVMKLSEQQKIPETLQRLKDAARQVQEQSGPPSSSVVSELEETRERAELASLALEGLFRRLVMPRLTRLREFEARTLQATDQMRQLQSIDEVGPWVRELRSLIGQLTEEQAAGSARVELAEKIAKNELPEDGRWMSAGGTLVPPQELQQQLQRITDELRRQILELILADFHQQHDEPVPATYADLVNSYLQVLSTNE